jgi:hypothetical protein
MNRSSDDIAASCLEHAALAQLHRWYLGYEQANPSLANQLDILSEAVRVKSGLGEAQGHAAYAERLTQLPKSWQNAHFVHDTRFAIEPDGHFLLAAQVTYLNHGILADGGVRSAELTYTTRLCAVPGSVLPKFESLQIDQRSEGRADAFRSAYARNRLLSLLHYWLALVEHPSRNTAPLREILATPSVDEGTRSAVWPDHPGAYRVVDFSLVDDGPDRYAMAFDLDRLGAGAGAEPAPARERHRWVVIDNPSERFARIHHAVQSAVGPT